MAKEIEEIKAPETMGFDVSDDVTWDTVHVEAGDQVEFETVGDTLIARYAGHELIYPKQDDNSEWFIKLNYTVPEGAVFVNAGHELQTAFVNVSRADDGSLNVTDKVAPGTLTRITLMKLVDTGKKDLMKSYRVDSMRETNTGA